MITSEPTSGTARVEGDQIRYWPAGGRKGSVRLGYGLQVDGAIASGADVRITVLPPLAAVASALDDHAVTLAGVPVTVPVLYNDVSTGYSLATLGRPANGAIEAVPSPGCDRYCPPTEIRYTPTPGFAGQDSFRYSLSGPSQAGDHGASSTVVDTARVSVTVTPAWSEPDHALAVDDQVIVHLKGSVTFNPLANDTVPDGWSLSLSKSTTAHGTVAWNSDYHEMTYRPNADASTGTDTFTYSLVPPARPRVSDHDEWGSPTATPDPTSSDGEGTLTATVTVLINGPIAVDDSAVTDPFTEVTIPVSANDSGTTGYCLQIATPAKFGNLDQSESGVFYYTPENGFAGTDVFTYQYLASCDDPDSAAAQATVTITVRPPSVMDDSAQTYPGRPVTIDVQANDLNGHGFALVAGPAQRGTTTVLISGDPDNPDRTISYTPSADFTSGTDTFPYQLISLDDAVVGRGQVTVRVLPVVARPDQSYTTSGQAVSIDVTGNDTVPDGASISVVTDPAFGTATIGTAPGTIVYRPSAAFDQNSNDSFEYAITVPAPGGECCGEGIVVDPASPDPTSTGNDDRIELARAKVTITRVHAVPDTVTAAFGLPVDLDPRANDVGADHLAVVLSTPPAADSLVVTLGDNGVFHVAPVAGFVGTATFSYALLDGDRTVDTSTVSVVVPIRPVAVDDAATTHPGVPVTVDVLANDLGSVGLVPRISARPDLGSVVVGTDNQITYTPDLGRAGPDTFQYQLFVPGGTTPLGTATVAITVEPPLAVDDDVTLFANQYALIPVLANDTSTDGFTIGLHQPDHGTATLEAGDVVRYTPTAGFSGTDQFDYDLVDARGAVAASATVVATVQLVTAVDDVTRIDGTSAVTIPVLANDTSVPGVTVTLLTGPAKGVATLNADGTVTYAPGSGLTDVDRFSYALSGLVRGVLTNLDQAQVTITLTHPVDDAAVTRFRTSIRIPVLGNDVNAAGLHPQVIAGPAHGGVTVLTGGRIRYHPTGDFHGHDSFRYTLTGGGRSYGSATVTVTVRPPPSTGGGGPATQPTPITTTPASPRPATSHPVTTTTAPTPTPTPTPTSTPVTPISVKLDAGSADPGAPVDVTGSRCPAGGPVQVSLDGRPVASVNANASGSFAATIHAPAEIGRHQVAVTCGAATWTTHLDVAVTTMESAVAVPAAGAVAAAALLLFFLLSSLGLNPTGRRPRTSRP